MVIYGFLMSKSNNVFHLTGSLSRTRSVGKVESLHFLNRLSEIARFGYKYLSTKIKVIPNKKSMVKFSRFEG